MRNIGTFIEGNRTGLRERIHVIHCDVEIILDIANFKVAVFVLEENVL